MRLLFRLAVVLILVLVVGAAAALYLGVDREPLVAHPAPLTSAQVERARRLLARNDPRKLRHGEVRTVTLSEEELTLLLDYLLSRVGGGGASVQVGPGRIRLIASLDLPRNPLGRYVNVDMTIGPDTRPPRIERLAVGRLPVPAFIANAVLRSRLALVDDGGLDIALDAIRELKAEQGTLHATYRWDERLPDAVRERLVPRADRERLRAYQTRLAQAVEARPGKGPVALADLLAELMALARSREGEAAAENRAVLVVLFAYANGRRLDALVPEARDWPAARSRTVRLRGRRDFARHFITSAALAALGDVGIADAVGLYKEVDDSRGGSGFSFRDLAADRAGTRFGEAATGTPDGALALQRRVASGVTDAELLPAVDDLPENMQEAEFKARFGDIGSAAYLELAGEIERRIDDSALYRR